MQKEIFIIHGSPRKDGNTDLLVKSFLNGVSERKTKNIKIDINEIFANKVDVSPCRGCGNCAKTGECIVQDEMQDIYGHLLDCDLLVVSSPIFFTTVSGYLKAIIDRCQRFWVLKYERKEKIVKKKRNGILVSAAGSKPQDIFDCTKKVMRAFFDVLYIDYLKDFTFNQVDRKGDILENEKAIKELFDFGRNHDIFQ